MLLKKYILSVLLVLLTYNLSAATESTPPPPVVNIGVSKTPTDISGSSDVKKDANNNSIAVPMPPVKLEDSADHNDSIAEGPNGYIQTVSWFKIAITQIKDFDLHIKEIGKSIEGVIVKEDEELNAGMAIGDEYYENKVRAKKNYHPLARFLRTKYKLSNYIPNVGGFWCIDDETCIYFDKNISVTHVEQSIGKFKRVYRVRKQGFPYYEFEISDGVGKIAFIIDIYNPDKSRFTLGFVPGENGNLTELYKKRAVKPRWAQPMAIVLDDVYRNFVAETNKKRMDVFAESILTSPWMKKYITNKCIDLYVKGLLPKESLVSEIPVLKNMSTPVVKNEDVSSSIVKRIKDNSNKIDFTKSFLLMLAICGGIYGYAFYTKKRTAGLKEKKRKNSLKNKVKNKKETIEKETLASILEETINDIVENSFEKEVTYSNNLNKYVNSVIDSDKFDIKEKILIKDIIAPAEINKKTDKIAKMLQVDKHRVDYVIYRKATKKIVAIIIVGEKIIDKKEKIGILLNPLYLKLFSNLGIHCHINISVDIDEYDFISEFGQYIHEDIIDMYPSIKHALLSGEEEELALYYGRGHSLRKFK